MAGEIIQVPTAELRPHPLHRTIYGAPTENSAYADIKADMKARGFDERHPLLVTEDRRIVWGATRWAAARSLKIEAVPCRVYRPSGPATEELEIEREIIKDNTYRVKTRVMIAREQRHLLELESRLARTRQGKGGDGGPSKAVDRVGQAFGESGKTVARRLKVLGAIEKAQDGGDHRGAELLTGLLERDKTLQALDAVEVLGAASAAQADGDKKRAGRLWSLLDSGKTAQALAEAGSSGDGQDGDGGEGKRPLPRKVDVPRTMLDYAAKAHSEFYEACCKATLPSEFDVLEKYLGQMRDALETARARHEAPAGKLGRR